ncbi:putative glycosyl transferase [Xylogone sp. PMI_703]|nr:putative glycosyl transferase [Xylogone sp. PMI_703]
MRPLRTKAPFILTSFILIFLYCRSILKLVVALFSLQLTWHIGASKFYISQERDNFDVTFANYSITQDTAIPDYPDVVPPILHQIALGQNAEDSTWLEARNACLDLHPEWEVHMWTDENSGKFVEEKYPHLKKMWDEYKYPIQRVDSLRYMVLYEYGGAVLDMDLHCRRSLGPLRRFGFTAPAAHPVGFSNGMMMAGKRHPFIEQLVSNLPIYDRNWLWLPYPTVMFSTGCHYASTIHSLQKDREGLRILSGTEENPNLNRLNGDVITPLFHHLGASSWHSFDASFIVKVGKLGSALTLSYIAFLEVEAGALLLGHDLDLDLEFVLLRLGLVLGVGLAVR